MVEKNKPQSSADEVELEYKRLQVEAAGTTNSPPGMTRTIR